MAALAAVIVAARALCCCSAVCCCCCCCCFRSRLRRWLKMRGLKSSRKKGFVGGDSRPLGRHSGSCHESEDEVAAIHMPLHTPVAGGVGVMGERA